MDSLTEEQREAVRLIAKEVFNEGIRELRKEISVFMPYYPMEIGEEFNGRDVMESICMALDSFIYNMSLDSVIYNPPK